MSTTPKGPKRLERHFKGVANHRRIQILQLVANHRDITLVGIAERVKGNLKTVSEHTRRLVLAGLLEKKYEGRDVQHSLTPYGRIFIKFIDDFSKVPLRED
jgi:DNA-binding transcriptional ArsR family regulator